MNVDPTGEAFLVYFFAGLIAFLASSAISATTQAAFNNGHVDWGVVAIDGAFSALSAVLWMVPGLGPVATGLINAGLTIANSYITLGIDNNWQYSLIDHLTIAGTAIFSGLVSYKLRADFFTNGGKKLLQESHRLVGTIEQRIVSGYYNDGVNIVSKSLASASGHMFKELVGLNFGKGFIRDWAIQILQFSFSSSLLKGIKNFKW